MSKAQDVSTDTTAEFFLCHRGMSKMGVMGTKWFATTVAPLSLEAAMKEGQQLFESGLIYHPGASEFEICKADGTVFYESKPPHGHILHWKPSTR